MRTSANCMQGNKLFCLPQDSLQNIKLHCWLQCLYIIILSKCLKMVRYLSECIWVICIDSKYLMINIQPNSVLIKRTFKIQYYSSKDTASKAVTLEEKRRKVWLPQQQELETKGRQAFVQRQAKNIFVSEYLLCHLNHSATMIKLLNRRPEGMQKQPLVFEVTIGLPVCFQDCWLNNKSVSSLPLFLFAFSSTPLILVLVVFGALARGILFPNGQGKRH